jgi:predicted O-methyltransferase YrrM
MNNYYMLVIVGELLCGMASIYLDLRRHHMSLLHPVKTSPLVYLDILSTALVLASAPWGLANLLFLHLTTRLTGILEIIFCTATFAYLWGEGRRANQFQRPAGIVLGEFFVLSGVADIALSSIEQHHWSSHGGLISILAGGLLLSWIVPRFLKKKEEHHILERLGQQGEIQQPEYTPPTLECPHPERWTMMDSMSAEIEILDFLKQLILTLKPELIVETGTFIGASTIKMAEGLKTNGFGKIVTCEFDPLVYAKAKERIDRSDVAPWIDARNQSSLEMQVQGTIDIFFSDSHLPIREDEIRRFLPQISPNGLILMHDTSSHYKIAREAAFRLEQDGLISMVLLPTPRGLMIGQKRAGRK